MGSPPTGFAGPLRGHGRRTGEAGSSAVVPEGLLARPGRMASVGGWRGLDTGSLAWTGEAGSSAVVPEGLLARPDGGANAAGQEARASRLPE